MAAFGDYPEPPRTAAGAEIERLQRELSAAQSKLDESVKSSNYWQGRFAETAKERDELRELLDERTADARVREVAIEPLEIHAQIPDPDATCEHGKRFGEMCETCDTERA